MHPNAQIRAKPAAIDGYEGKRGVRSVNCTFPERGTWVEVRALIIPKVETDERSETPSAQQN